jgi:hypothetical protein
MKLRDVWWVVLLVLFSLLMASRAGLILKGVGIPSPQDFKDIVIFIVWIAVLLWPLFGEVSLLGFKFKKDTDFKVSKPEDLKAASTGGTTPRDLGAGELSDEALRMLSTLWRHQQQYDPQIWQFAVGPKSPHYRTYAIGLGDTMRLGLTTVSPDNGMVFLTVDGIEYSRRIQDKLSSIGWDYSRWQRP